jgi:hypothetical protein
VTDQKCTDQELDTLYALLTNIGLKASDVVKEIRREGKKIGHLGELSSFEVRKLIADCRRYVR